jgi:threonyl-tRNA synthetase
MAVVGPRDAENNAVSVRMRGVQKDLGAMPLAAFVEGLAREVATRGAEPLRLAE